MKHTKEKWKMGQFGKKGKSLSVKVWSLDSLDKRQKYICEVFSHSMAGNIGNVSEEEMKANAKLIAAAPDMLEALNGLVNLSGIQAWIENPQMKNLLTERLNNAVEAIKRATE